MLFADDYNQSVTPLYSTRSSCGEATHANVINNNDPSSKIKISHEQNTDAPMFNTIRDSEEEIQAKQIRSIYDLLNDDNLTTTDFLEQLKMYGVQIDDDTELQSP